MVVEHWRGDDAAIHQKITTEARAGVYNVDVASTEINVITDLKKSGLMKRYSWPNTAAWAPKYKDRDGYWIARHILCVVMATTPTSFLPPSRPRVGMMFWTRNGRVRLL